MNLPTTIKSFQDYLNHIERIRLLNYEINLFRGQSANAPLLPQVARGNSVFDTTALEKEMLGELKRRSVLLIDKQPQTDWEWLVLAQHYLMKTRLLDWSSNPLVALWFACEKEYQLKEPAYVYVYSEHNSMLLNPTDEADPFTNLGTKIFQPPLNNKRIVAQAGWFTVHHFSTVSNRFVALEDDNSISGRVAAFKIPANKKVAILKSLAIYGVSNKTMFPDIEGICLHLNWKYKDRLTPKILP